MQFVTWPDGPNSLYKLRIGTLSFEWDNKLRVPIEDVAVELNVDVKDVETRLKELNLPLSIETEKKGNKGGEN